MDSVAADLRYAVRLLVRSPAFTLVTILTLALGIGANTAIFSTVDAVLLHALPFGEPDRMVMVWEDASFAGFPHNTPAPANFVDWKARNHVFSDMAATRGAGANLTDEGRPERVRGRAVTPNFFSVLQVRPAIGRTFTDEEDRQGAQVVVIGYGLWQRRFQGDASAIGRTLTMDGTAFTVVGVLPRGFVFRDREIEYWVPAHFTAAFLAQRGSHLLNVIARLKPEASLQQAREDMRRIASQLEAEYPANRRLGAVVVPIDDDTLGAARAQLIVLICAAGSVLLIACANLASLLLSRAVSRRGELGVRAALGARPARLVRQLLVEAALLSTTGGAVGLLIAPLGVAVVMRLVPVGLAEPPMTVLNARLLVFTLGLSLVTALLFGLVPAAQAAGSSLSDVIQHAGSRTVGAGRRLTRDGLVVLQVAVALVLLVAAGLMLRTLANLRALELGFRPDHLLTMSTSLPANKYRDGVARLAFFQRVVDGVKAIPGVVGAAYVSNLPFMTEGDTITFDVEGRVRAAGDAGDALLRAGTGEYLATLGVTLVEGRLPDDRDGASAPPIAIVNEALARLYWPDATALGHRIQIGRGGVGWYTIVGVVRNVRERGYEPLQKPSIYLSYAQAPDTWAIPVVLLARTTGDPLAVAASARQVVADADPEQPISLVRSMDDILDANVADRQQQATLLGAFAGLALLLASVGLYGVLSYVVTQRSREIGVRMALGATRSDVMRLVMGRGVLLTAIGLALGSAAAWAATRAMASLLYGVAPTDPATFAAVVGVLLSVGVLACLVPAIRATRLNPLAVLRQG